MKMGHLDSITTHATALRTALPLGTEALNQWPPPPSGGWACLRLPPPTDNLEHKQNNWKAGKDVHFAPEVVRVRTSLSCPRHSRA